MKSYPSTWEKVLEGDSLVLLPGLSAGLFLGNWQRGTLELSQKDSSEVSWAQGLQLWTGKVPGLPAAPRDPDPEAASIHIIISFPTFSSSAGTFFNRNQPLSPERCMWSEGTETSGPTPGLVVDRCLRQPTRPGGGLLEPTAAAQHQNKNTSLFLTNQNGPKLEMEPW